MEDDSIASYLRSALGGMPDWLPFAVQGAGTLLRARADNQVRNAQQSRIQAEMVRQHALQQQADARMAQALPQFTRPAQDQARTTLATNTQAQITPQSGQGGTGEFVPDNPGSPQVVQSDIARAVAGAMQKGRDYAKTTANLSSYGGQNFANSIALNRNAQEMNRIGDFSQNSSAILPQELQGAQLAGRNTRVASDVANGLGQIGSIYALMRQQPKKPITMPGASTMYNVDGGV